jgi:hypothetical protein
VFNIVTQAPLFQFTSHTFDEGRVASGYRGPTLAQCQTAYNTTWDGNANYFTVVGIGIQQWTVPATGMYEIDAYGATGGKYRRDLGNNHIVYYYGGKGARIKGTFSLTRGDIIQILVGQVADQSEPNGGGGGTFVYKSTTSTLLIAAGGGGGIYYAQQQPRADIADANIHENGKSGWGLSGGVGGTNGYGGGKWSNYGGGGAGWFSDGADGSSNTGGHSFANGGSGGTSSYKGGFGGGGGTSFVNYPGGGGGYSGGGAAESNNGPAGGGGSYISPLAIDVLKEVNYSVNLETVKLI